MAGAYDGWRTNKKGKRLMKNTIALVLFAIAAAAVNAFATDGAVSLKGLSIETPTPFAPYYHYQVELVVPEPTTVHIHSIKINDAPERNFIIRDKSDRIDESEPRHLRRLAISEAVKSPRPERTFKRPVIIGRANWGNGERVAVEISLSLGDATATPRTLTAEAQAPASGGYWDSRWAHYQSVVLSETAGIARDAEPVKVTFLYYLDTMTDPYLELRIIKYDWRQQAQTEVPSQILDIASVPNEELPMYNEHGEQKPATFMPTGSVTVAFPATAPAHGSSVYLIFYGNPDAPTPAYTSGLVVAGEMPGHTVDNEFYRLQLHNDSGMLDEVTLKNKPEYTFVHKKETNGAIHWNPDCYAPPRAWAHVSDWKPGLYDFEYEESRGPVVFRTRRWGEMPLMPEVTVSMEYEFYEGVPYFLARSSMSIRHDVSVQALRNSEIVFAREAFSEAAWWDEQHQRIETRHIISQPDLTEWTLPDTTPWLAFFDGEKKTGFAGIQGHYANASLVGDLRTYNPYIYITTGPWIYWTRALAYPYGSRNPQQLIKVEAGSVFLEEWAYLPFELGEKESTRFSAVNDWYERFSNPLLVHLEDPTDPRMQVPEEIYIEPKATGWE